MKENNQQIEYIMGIISAPENIAEEIAHTIVKEKKAACAQVTQKITSYYWWKKKIHCDPEVLIFIKTKKNLIPQVQDLLNKIHPYDVPEFITLPISDGNPAYFKWIDETLLQ